MNLIVRSELIICM